MPDEQKQQEQKQEEKKVEDKTLTFDGWLEKQPDEVKMLLESNTKGLKTALESERGNRKDMEKQLRDMAKKAEAGSEAQTQLTKLADDLQSADRKTDFYEAAHAAGVRNLKLAFTVATSDEMFDKHGRVNFDEMKKQYPELFGGTPLVRGDAGSGTNRDNHGAEDMNSRIRRVAGRE
jgi:F0F1-type ATP synthase epsilon subunit